ncbi:metal ABC transporter solute-binding protein, Zn/Mn family [Limosilactobacillus pontis]|uniref:ABC transporter, substrate-binding protein n=1 Tax=Limosilactobacillus pontis DSM 8475 TaxID=1423794 RepID=A0A922TMY6_9LACO|nr:zinc ABC transporter substrate-binding protein [Limosilactobacillus pontis]KRM37375.1 ABC transporter, substrate-binding protein [Limosilactobacillus pontis DSM 8475]QFV00447.1 metal ABC transporter substrate-binding protein [Limosilactobacillus pontis]
MGRKKYWLGVSGLIVALLVILGLSLVPWRNIHRERRPIRVITSLDFYGEVAQEVAGKYGQVTALINNASIDPHDYQPGTKQAQRMAQANVVIQNGLGYDHWLTKLTQSAGGQHDAVVDVGQEVAGKCPGANEHVWYDPQTMGRLANTLAERYGKIDPEHRAYYRRRAQQYHRSLAPLNHEIAKVKAHVGAKRAVAVSEPVADYALESLGYQVIDPHFEKAIEDGNDPSPQDIQELQRAIVNHRIAFFVENSQASDRVIDNLVHLAHEHGVPVLKVTETKPNGVSYVQWMTKQYRQLARIQQEGE